PSPEQPCCRCVGHGGRTKGYTESPASGGDMAGLKAVAVGGMLYVTTRKNAELLKAEEERRAARLPKRKSPKRKRLPVGNFLGIITPMSVVLDTLKDKEEDRESREWAADFLSDFYGRQALPDPIEALKDRHGEVRRLAARALGRMGAKAKEASPHLIK